MHLKNFLILQAVITSLFPIYSFSHNLDPEEIVYPTEYVHPVDDDRTIPLPYITLRAKLIRHTFPGTPNYESIEGGDMPEPRWVLEVLGSEIRRLIDSNYLTEDLYYPDKNGWIQLIAVGDEDSPFPLLNKQVIVQGYLGTLISHIHTPATLEAKEMHEDIQYNNKWIKAEEGPEKNSVIYTDADGNQLTRFWKAYEGQPDNEASTRSWRNNNPGNHAIGNFARKKGAIGFAGKIPNKESKEFWFAVYPDYETGRKAQALRLKEGTLYINSTLNAFVRTYLGIKKELPDTQAVLDYRKAIKFFTKFDMERTIRSLNDEEYIQLLDAMKNHEDWREGREEYTPAKMKKVLGVHMKRHVITEFLVGNLSESSWITKKEAIALAEAEKLIAIVVHTKGEPYLRPKAHQSSFREMVIA